MRATRIEVVRRRYLERLCTLRWRRHFLYFRKVSAMPFVSRFAVYGTHGWVEVRDKAHVEAPEGWVVIKGSKGAGS